MSRRLADVPLHTSTFRRGPAEDLNGRRLEQSGHECRISVPLWTSLEGRSKRGDAHDRTAAGSWGELDRMIVDWAGGCVSDCQVIESLANHDPWESDRGANGGAPRLQEA